MEETEGKDKDRSYPTATIGIARGERERRIEGESAEGKVEAAGYTFLAQCY